MIDINSFKRIKEAISVQFAKVADLLPVKPLRDPNDDEPVPFQREGNGSSDITSYPEYLIYLSKLCATHRAILNGKTRMIVGDGIDFKDNKKLSEWAVKVNENGESLDNIVSQVAADLELFNAFYIRLIPNKLRDGYAAIEHLPANCIRANKSFSVFWYQKDWTKNDYYDAIKFPIYDANKIRDCILPYRTLSAGYNVYPEPSYVAALAAIEVQIEISQYHLSNIRQGFEAKTMIGLPDSRQNDTEKALEKRDFEKAFSGSSNGGNTLYYTYDTLPGGGGRLINIDTIPSDSSDTKYLQLSEWSIDTIFTGHEVTSPMLFGIRTAGQLGGRNELNEALDIFHVNYVKPRQREIEGVLQAIFDIMGIDEIAEIMPMPKVPVEFGEGTVAQVLTKDEIRERLGLEVSNPEDMTTAERLNSLNPAALNALLNSLTPAGKFAAYGIEINPEYLISDTIKPEFKMSSQDFEYQLSERLASMGNDADDYIIFDTDEVPKEGKINVALAKATEGEISVLAVKILKIINDGKLTTPEEIAEAVKVKVSKVEGVLDYLKDEGLVSKRAGNNSTYDITKDGARQLKNPEVRKIEVSLMYKYQLRPGIDGPIIIDTSREFCRKVVKANKLYTGADLNLLSSALGFDVIAHSGGYYHNPRTGQTEEKCRHEFVIVSVSKRKK